MSADVNRRTDDIVSALATMTETLARLETALTPSEKAVALPGARVVPFTSSASISRSPGRLVGFALRNTDSGNPATVYLRDGNDADGALIVPVQLAAGESTGDAWAIAVSFVDGLYVDVNAGTVEGAVYLGAVD